MFSNGFYIPHQMKEVNTAYSNKSNIQSLLKRCIVIIVVVTGNVVSDNIDNNDTT